MSFLFPWLSAIKFSSLKATRVASLIYFYLKIMNIIAHTYSMRDSMMYCLRTWTVEHDCL